MGFVVTNFSALSEGSMCAVLHDIWWDAADDAYIQG